MILRLRSRDGLERVSIDASASLAQLKAAIHAQLGVPLDGLALSKDPNFLSGKAPHSELISGSLTSLGLSHGDLVFMAYPGERHVEPVYKPGPLDRRPYGLHTTVGAIAAKQTRIERQDGAKVAGVSFDRSAAQTFQAYLRSALAFSIKRGGLLYGTVDDKGNVRVEVVYEPEQQGSIDSLQLLRGGPEEAQADALADLLGLRKVGWIFSQAVTQTERDFIVSATEVEQMAAMQDEMGPSAVTVLVTLDPNEGGGQVHFEVFQASEQAVALWKTGWMVAPEPGSTPSGIMRLRNPAEPDLAEAIIVAGKDASEVDNDWFLCPVKIQDHEGPLTAGAFPVENRLIPQTKNDLRDVLRRGPSRPYEQRLADFHVLLWLSKQLDLSVMGALCDAVIERKPLLEGYRCIVDSLADV